MKALSILVAAGLVASLTGCGGPTVSTPKANKEPAKTTQPATASPAPAAPSTPTAPSSPAPGSQAPKTDAPDKPATSEAPKPAAPTSLGEFAENVVGGKPLGLWMELLNSKKKDEVVEACAALAIARSKANAAVPKLTELSKNTDKDIAAEAQEALRKITGK